tara:strand:- start:19 stop:300 length:282 start_codon:yes stop_codon:yes gene_type:complete
MKITKINKGNWGKIKAFFDLETEEGFTIKGFKIVEGIDGIFIGFPSQKNEKDGEYYDTIWADKELKQKVEQLAAKEFDGSDADVSINAAGLPF